ncbi:MAG TPA: hypothetical protein VK568_07825 [Thermodesulfobacteriota bacterium]|nr:hypothetical protein [Thermodesulfobacteriota bacterium]
MGEEKKCPLFRQPEILSSAEGSGYCDLDNSSKAYEGDVRPEFYRFLKMGEKQQFQCLLIGGNLR